jgi:plasmid stability protein
MQRTNIYLDEDTVRSLKLLAAARGTTMSDLIRDAVRDMMAGEKQRDWSGEIRALLDSIGRRNLPELSEEEIVAEVRAARAERRRTAGRA